MNEPMEPTDCYELFLQLFNQNRSRLFAYIRSLLPNNADAEDVFQRCSVLLWRKIHQFDQQRDFFPWACGVAYYEVQNFLRVSGRSRLQFDDALINQLSERRLETADDLGTRLDALRLCVQQLPGHDRSMVEAAYHEGETLVDYAKRSGRSLRTLYNRMSLIRRQLSSCVERKLSVSENQVINQGAAS
ncbi:sigma-70 family RNA polymerase sigma factor [Stieleria sp. TO1_6]|uniref:sigma-70 family RNA polymerase sigma factor n=1 Tax=Stieleria tagensis TaxID=2956795 RepID=UPI00209AF93F|nr:sigma-70 family RNA polymerase sigma factor [Stieleria tagensis]MCO8122394.1 sigma-70 family RNA polymerase sigma factor [Stieleria tagensis]